MTIESSERELAEISAALARLILQLKEGTPESRIAFDLMERSDRLVALLRAAEAARDDR